MTTNGPFASGTQNFYNNSSFDANAADAATGNSLQFFYDTSSLNASAAGIASGSTAQFFYNSSVLNAGVADAINDRVQRFTDTSRLNITATDAVSGGTQGFYGSSILSLTATGGLSGGTQVLFDQSNLNVDAAGSITGGAQTFYTSSALNAGSAGALSGGSQDFHDASRLNANMASAVDGGLQGFVDNSSLNANVSDAISGGTQTFMGSSSLQANASGAIKGGSQAFYNAAHLEANAADVFGNGTQQVFHQDSILNANVGHAVSNGGQVFQESAVLNALVADSIVGGSQRFFDDSTLKADVTSSINGGFQLFHDNSVLQANASGAVGNSAIHLYNNAVVQVNADNALTATSGMTFDDSNGGPGGTLRLNGHNTSLGVIMSVNSSASPAGIITNGAATAATFTVDDSANPTTSAFYGVIQDGGAGALNLKRIGSTGLLYLAAANTYTGTTTIAGGTLSLLGAGDIASSSGVDLTDVSADFDISNATGGSRTIRGLSGVSGSQVNLGATTLVIDSNGNTAFAGAIMGTGDLVKQGSGTLILSGASNFSGATDVRAGRLAVNGTFLNSIVEVEQTGVLGGNGTIAGLLAGLGGTVAPGNSIGTLQVNGNANLGQASIYQVEVDATGQSDLLNATGQVIIDPSSVVRVLAASGHYAPSTTYTILSAGGGITGAFGGASSNSLFLVPSLSYDPNNVYLILTSNGTSFTDVAKTRNQRAAATGASSLAPGNAVYDAIMASPDLASAQAAYDSLSGEVHAAAGGQLLRDAHYVGDAVIGRLQQADRLSGDTAAREIAYLTPAEITTAAGSADTLAIWGQAFGGWSAVDSDGNAGALDRTLAGFLMGIDGQVAEDWRLGVAAGYSRSDLDLSARNSTASIDGYHVALYGGGHVGPVALRLGASYSFNNIDSQRDVTVGSLSDHDKASYQARTAQVFGEVGYDLKLGPVALEPFAGMAYVNLDTDGFKEKGGASALHGKGQNQDMPYSTLGLRVAGEIAKLGGGSLTAHGMLGWRHAYGDVTPTADLSFGGGSSAFTVAGTPIARDALVAQAGLDLNITDRLTVGLAYDGQIAGNAQDNAVHGSFTWKF